jgi:hypothetical protein
MIVEQGLRRHRIGVARMGRAHTTEATRIAGDHVTEDECSSNKVSGDTVLASLAWAELIRLRQPRIAVDHVTEDE